MAMNARDIPLTREQIHEWIQEYRALLPDKKGDEIPPREFLDTKLEEKGLKDVMVNTVGHESFGDEMALADMILMDIESYG
jgi:hypothetical protein